jgi:hypothetical protein
MFRLLQEDCFFLVEGFTAGQHGNEIEGFASVFVTQLIFNIFVAIQITKQFLISVKRRQNLISLFFLFLLV